MRLKLITLVLAVCLPVIRLQANPDAVDARKDQVRAATCNAIDALSETLAAEQITAGLTVKEFLDRTKGTERFTETLRRAQQIGGPRWVDKTCQVRLEISGVRARAVLVQIATTEGKKSPLAADVLALRLKDWDNRAFAATGSSASASELANARPLAADDLWAKVSDDARRSALQAAKDNAVDRALNSAGEVSLQSNLRVSDALKDPAVRADIVRWLQTRPVTEIEFRQDRQVHVTLSAAPEEFVRELRKSLADHAKPIDDPELWARATRDLSERLKSTGEVQGLAELADSPLPATEPAVVPLPAVPPSWASEQREAEGSAPAGDSKLKSARVAEADAVEELAKQIKDLPLDAQTTLGQAAERDPHMQAALDRAMARARTFKVDYHSDGGAQVKVAIDLAEVWNELHTPH